MHEKYVVPRLLSEIAANITNEGFEPRLVRLNMYGSGTYLTPNSCKVPHRVRAGVREEHR